MDTTGLPSTRNPTADAMIEVRSYRAEALLKRVTIITNKEGKKEKKENDPLKWWKKREMAYPRLCKLVKARLCIVATSVPSERVFSKTGQLVSERRNRLSPAKVSQLAFLNFNLK